MDAKTVGSTIAKLRRRAGMTQATLAAALNIRAVLDTPLVLHGGSGLSDDGFKNTVRDGIAKINIFTDLCVAGENAVRDGLAEGLGYLDIRNRKVAYIQKAVENKMRLFGSNGRY